MTYLFTFRIVYSRIPERSLDEPLLPNPPMSICCQPLLQLLNSPSTSADPNLFLHYAILPKSFIPAFSIILSTYPPLYPDAKRLGRATFDYRRRVHCKYTHQKPCPRTQDNHNSPAADRYMTFNPELPRYLSYNFLALLTCWAYGTLHRMPESDVTQCTECN